MSTEEKKVPPFVNSPRTSRVITAALMALQDGGLSYRQQTPAINEWSTLHGKRLGLRPFTFTHQRWTDFVSNPGIGPKKADIRKFAWHWLFEEHPWAIEGPAATMPHEHPGIPNPLVPTMLEFMSPGADVQLGRLERLRGSFAAYRHSFVNHNDVMVMAMECGVDDDISKFRIAMIHRRKGGKERNENVDGYAIPYEDHIMFVGRLVEIGAPFIFILSGLAPDAENRIERGHGTLLVGAPGVSSSAFPIVVRRVEDKFDPSILDLDRFRNEIDDFDEIEPYLKKGKVWLSENY